VKPPELQGCLLANGISLRTRSACMPSGVHESALMSTLKAYHGRQAVPSDSHSVAHRGSLADQSLESSDPNHSIQIIEAMRPVRA
jgi:hypothetical protein